MPVKKTKTIAIKKTKAVVKKKPAIKLKSTISKSKKTKKSKTSIKTPVKKVHIIKPVKKLTIKKKKVAISSKKTPTTNKKKAKPILKSNVKTQEKDIKQTKTTSNLEAPTFTPYQSLENEQYMNEKQLLHFKTILKTWQDDLMQEVDNTLTELKEAGAPLPDLNDRATQEENINFELRARDRERKLLKKINETLQKIDEQTYGYCDMCGVEIGIRRLEARPTATLCIDCKTISEIKEKRT